MKHKIAVTYPDFVESKEFAISVHLFEINIIINTFYMFEQYHLFNFEFDGILIEKENNRD